MTKTSLAPPSELPALLLDLNNEITELNSQSALLSAGRAAKTLVIHSDLRIVLTAVRKGTRISEHHVPGSISIQTLRGEIALHVQNQIVVLPAGHALVLSQNTAHDVVAHEDSTFLVTIAWPNAAK